MEKESMGGAHSAVKMLTRSEVREGIQEFYTENPNIVLLNLYSWK